MATKPTRLPQPPSKTPSRWNDHTRPDRGGAHVPERKLAPDTPPPPPPPRKDSEK